jgi:hypothetical protein
VVRDNSGLIVADAISQAGQRLSRVAKVKEQKDDGMRYHVAKSILLHAEEAASRELKEINDYTTWQKAYEDRMSKARDEAAKQIRSDHDRALFEMDASLHIERGVGKVLEDAKRREVDDDRAGLQRMIEDNRNAILESEDPERRRQFIEVTKAAIKGAQEKGSLTAQEAEHMDTQWSRDLAEGSLVMMPAEARAAILANPEGTIAEFLSPDRRAILHKQAMDENKVTRTRAAMQSHSDRIMSSFESMADALSEARKIDDPDVREMTVDDVKSRFNEIKAIESEADQQRFEESANVIEQGGKITDIAPGDWAKLSVNEKQALEVRQRQVMTAEEPIHDDAKYYEWSQMPVEQQAKENLLTWRPYFDDPHYNRAVERQRSILDAKEGGEKAVALTSAMSLGQRVEKTLLSGDKPLFKKKPTSSSGAEQIQRWARIESAIYDRIEQDSAAKGRKLEPLEMQKHVDDVVMERFFIDEWGKDPQVIGAEITPEQRKKAYVPYDEIPASQRSRLENYAQSMGFKPSEMQIGKAYAAFRMQEGDDRIIELLSD